MVLTIKNTHGKVCRTLTIETRLYCLERAFFYCGYDMRKCYNQGTATLKQRDIRDFVIYLKAFTKQCLNN